MAKNLISPMGCPPEEAVELRSQAVQSRDQMAAVAVEETVEEEISCHVEQALPLPEPGYL